MLKKVLLGCGMFLLLLGAGKFTYDIGHIKGFQKGATEFSQISCKMYRKMAGTDLFPCLEVNFPDQNPAKLVFKSYFNKQK